MLNAAWFCGGRGGFLDSLAPLLLPKRWCREEMDEAAKQNHKPTNTQEDKNPNWEGDS